MGNFANTLFSSLLGWLRGAAAWVWSFLGDQDSGGFIVWVADNWLALILLLCAACMLIDVIVYMVRWQPYKVWASFFRRLTGRDEDEEEKGRIRRRWIHADGTTSIEVIDASEAPQEQLPQAFAVPAKEELSARYERYARPQSEPAVAPAFAAEPLPEPTPEPAPVAEATEPTDRPSRPAGRRRRYLESDEELPLRYAPPPASEEAPAYHEPYYPPQWKRPADTGSSNMDLGGSGL